MLPIEQNLTNRNKKIGINKPEFIVIHDVGALGQAHANAIYFKDEARQSSAHYFVDTKTIVQVVEDMDAAYHVGDGHTGGTYGKQNIKGKFGITNLNSIGVELCLNPNFKSIKESHIEKQTIINAIELVRHLQKKYNIPNSRVVRHYDASRKLCPARMSANNWAEWKAFLKALDVQPAPKPINKPLPIVIKPTQTKEGTHSVKKGDTLWAIATKHKVTVVDLKQMNGLKSDALKIGQVLTLPVTKQATTPAKKATPAPKVKKYNLPSATYWVKSPNFKGEGVKVVQQALSSIHYYPDKADKNNGVDGIYGAKTASAVKRFQSMHGLKADGVYGPATRKKLDQIVNK